MRRDADASISRLNPPELGPPPGYSQVVEVHSGRFFFIAGQTAVDRGGALVGEDDFAAQADQVFRNLAMALEAVGCTAANLVKLTVFLRDMDNLGAYRELPQSLLRNRESARGAGDHARRGVEALSPGVSHRD